LHCISNGLQKTAGLARPKTNACSHWSGYHRKTDKPCNLVTRL